MHTILEQGEPHIHCSSRSALPERVDTASRLVPREATNVIACDWICEVPRKAFTCSEIHRDPIGKLIERYIKVEIEIERKVIACDLLYDCQKRLPNFLIGRECHGYSLTALAAAEMAFWLSGLVGCETFAFGA